MKLARSVLFVIWLYASMGVIGVAWWIPVMLDDRYVWAALRAWARAILWGLRWMIGARVRFEGLEHVPKGGALIAMKHQSMLDTVAPALFLEKPVFVFKKELVNTPVMGAYLARNQIAVDRGGHATALKSMMRGARARHLLAVRKPADVHTERCRRLALRAWDRAARLPLGSLPRCDAASGHRGPVAADTVEAAQGGAAALLAFPRGPFDLVLTNIGMAGLNGWELAERLRKLDPQVPICFITGWGLHEEDQARLDAVGITRCLFKPVSPEELDAAIQAAIQPHA